MNTKKIYETPDIDLLSVLVQDILAASGEIGEDGGENDGEWT